MSALDTVTGSFDGSAGDWFAGLLSGANASTSGADYGGYSGGGYSPGYSASDFAESISDNVAEAGWEKWIPAGDSISAGTNTPNDVSVVSQGEPGYDNWSPTGKAMTSGQPKSMWDTASDFINNKDNEAMLKLGTGLGGNILSRYEKGMDAKKADQKLQELREYQDKVQKEKEDRADARAAASRGGGGGSSALEALAAKDAIDQANKAKYSASVSGLRPTGLINSRKKLTYVGGKPVFTDAGQLAQ